MPAASRTIYFKNNAGCLWEEPESYLRLEYYPGKREEAQFRALLSHARQALQRHGWNRILIDQQHMTAFSAAEANWLLHDWLPVTVRETGYRHGAVLLAHDVFARLAMTSVEAAANQQVSIYRNFSDEATALAWLLKQ
ncbi:MAG: STAS/SEC14 domain-containing protein [Janthinobacterium lividum]